MKEEQLHFIWRNRLFDSLLLDGQAIDVIDVGTQNSYDGADFQMARIRTDAMEWIGAVEIHERSSMWQQHGHQHDPNYNSVILHVVMEDNAECTRSANGGMIPTAVLKVDEDVLRRVDKLGVASKSLRCMPELLEVEETRREVIFKDLLLRRQMRKLDELKRRSTESNINAIFYQTLMRYMGAHQNNEVMESVAQSLPYLYLKKHSSDWVALEAMLLGQAGLIQDSPRDEYEEKLLSDYIFYKEKFGLKRVEGLHFGYMRLRPSSFPSRMLAIVAQIIHHESEVLAALTTIDKHEIQRILMLPPSEYWCRHIAFGHTQNRQMGGIGKQTLNSLIINVVIPTIYYYSEQIGDKVLGDRAMSWLSELSPEKNQYIRLFDKLGIKSQNAADTQAILELYHSYCIPFRCLSCPMASEIFRCFKSRNTRNDLVV